MGGEHFVAGATPGPKPPNCPCTFVPCLRKFLSAISSLWILRFIQEQQQPVRNVSVVSLSKPEDANKFRCQLQMVLSCVNSYVSGCCCCCCSAFRVCVFFFHVRIHTPLLARPCTFYHYHNRCYDYYYYYYFRHHHSHC